MNSDTVNERTCLLRVLIGKGDIAQSAAETIAQEDGWREAIELAFSWKALPELNHQLTVLGIYPSGSARDDLRTLSREAFLRSTMITARGLDAIDAIAREGIAVAAFKGLALIAAASFERGNRTLRDVDLLVAPEDVISAVEVLERCGYRRGFPGDLRDYFRFVRNSPGFSGNEAVLLTAPDGCDVDLHWRVGPRGSPVFESRSLLARAQRAHVSGRTVSVIGSIEGALLTVHHSLRNNFVPDEMIRDLLDLDAWVIQLDAREQLNSFSRAAHDCSLRSPALAMAEILCKLRPGDAITRAVAELHEGISEPMLLAARRIEELFFLQLRDGAFNSDMLYLLSRDAWKLILGGAVGGWRQYRQQMAAFETRKLGAALPMSSRVALLWRDAFRAKRNHWSVLRTLAQSKFVATGQKRAH